MNCLQSLFILAVFGVLAAFGQSEKLPLIKSNNPTVSIRDGEQLKKDGWRLAPEAKPDVYEAELINGKPHKVTFITDVDSISFTVEEGKKYDFVIQYGDKACYTQIVGVNFVPRSVFDKEYQARHKDKTLIEIPEVYELVNIAIAMTPYATEHRNLIFKDSDYYKKVRAWFGKYHDRPLLAALDAEMRKSITNYFNLKMNGYAFEFDKKGKIVQSKIYDRTGFPSEKVNSLRPYLAQLQSFSDASDFRRFYRENRKTYDEQIRFYRDEANIAGMNKWLDKNFPGTNSYDSYKVTFSPLVGANQASIQYESNGFRELQAQVNFPYQQDVKKFFPEGLSIQAEIVFRGHIVFTEINHGYIGPEGFKYNDRILKATSNRDRWVDKSMGTGYYPGRGAFDEYMNWALINLYVIDYAPPSEQDKIIAFINRAMTKGRGFPQFEMFSKFLVDLYHNRKPNQTVADLYPQIIEWFEQNNEQTAK